MLGWGSTYGAIQAASLAVRSTGRRVANAHLRYLNPFPRNLGEIVKAYKRVLVPEVNLGQLRKLIRAEFLVDAVGSTKLTACRSAGSTCRLGLCRTWTPWEALRAMAPREQPRRHYDRR